MRSSILFCSGWLTSIATRSMEFYGEGLRLVLLRRNEPPTARNSSGPKTLVTQDGSESNNHDPVLSRNRFVALRGLALARRMDFRPLVRRDGFGNYGLLINLRSRAAGREIQDTVRRESEDLGQVCDDQHLSVGIRMVRRHAVR